MKCLRFLVFLPAFFYSGFAFAIPNVWTTGFGQGRLEYLISNKKIKNKKGYRLGDNIKVIVKGASKEKHTIDFLVDDE